MNERDNIAKIFNCNCEHCYGRQNKISDFILADRERILGEIKECLENKIFTLRYGSTFVTCEYQLTIDKAIEIIKKYEGDV